MNIAAKLLKEKKVLLDTLRINDHKPNIQTDDCHDCHGLQNYIDHKHELEEPSYTPVKPVEFKPPEPPPVFTQNEKPSNVEEPIEDDIISESESEIEDIPQDVQISESESEDNNIETPIETTIQESESESEEDDIMFL